MFPSLIIDLVPGPFTPLHPQALLNNMKSVTPGSIAYATLMVHTVFDLGQI